MAVKLSYRKWYTRASIYLSPNESAEEQTLIDVLHRLLELFIIMDDLNARHTLWCDRESNTRGHLLERVLADKPVSVLNDTGLTHIDPRTKPETCIDLTLRSNTITLDFLWNIQGFLYNSDHFPICLNFNNSVEVEIPQKGHFQNADWKRFANLVILDNIPEFLMILMI